MLSGQRQTKDVAKWYTETRSFDYPEAETTRQKYLMQTERTIAGVNYNVIRSTLVDGKIHIGPYFVVKPDLVYKDPSATAIMVERDGENYLMKVYRSATQEGMEFEGRFTKEVKISKLASDSGFGLELVDYGFLRHEGFALHEREIEYMREVREFDVQDDSVALDYCYFVYKYSSMMLSGAMTRLVGGNPMRMGSVMREVLANLKKAAQSGIMHEACHIKKFAWSKYEGPIMWNWQDACTVSKLGIVDVFEGCKMTKVSFAVGSIIKTLINMVVVWLDDDEYETMLERACVENVKGKTALVDAIDVLTVAVSSVFGDIIIQENAIGQAGGATHHLYQYNPEYKSVGYYTMEAKGEEQEYNLGDDFWPVTNEDKQPLTMWFDDLRGSDFKSFERKLDLMIRAASHGVGPQVLSHGVLEKAMDFETKEKHFVGFIVTPGRFESMYDHLEGHKGDREYVGKALMAIVKLFIDLEVKASMKFSAVTPSMIAWDVMSDVPVVDSLNSVDPPANDIYTPFITVEHLCESYLMLYLGMGDDGIRRFRRGLGERLRSSGVEFNFAWQQMEVLNAHIDATLSEMDLSQ